MECNKRVQRGHARRTGLKATSNGVMKIVKMSATDVHKSHGPMNLLLRGSIKNHATFEPYTAAAMPRVGYYDCSRCSTARG